MNRAGFGLRGRVAVAGSILLAAVGAGQVHAVSAAESERAMSSAAAAHLATGTAVHTARRDDAAVLFAATRAIPSDVSFYVHAEDAVAIRARHGRRPIAGVLVSMLQAANATEAWAGLAGVAGMTPESLFNAAFGGTVSLVGRSAADGGVDGAGRPTTQWALLLGRDRTAMRDVFRDWPLERRVVPGIGVEVCALPEAGVLIHVLPGTLVICSEDAPGLAREVVERARREFGGIVPRRGGPGGVADLPAITGRDGNGNGGSRSLWHRAGVRAGLELGTGSVAAWFAHGDHRGGGWSSLVIDALPEAEDRVRIAAAAAFDGAPFERPVPTTAWPGAIVDALGESAMAVFAEPTEIGWGRSGAWLSRQLNTSLLSRRLRGVLGSRCVYVIGEVEGRRLDPPVDAALPAVAVAIEMRTPIGLGGELDQHMASILLGIGRMAGLDGAGDPGQAAPSGLPIARLINHGGAGHADLGPAIDRWWRGGEQAGVRRAGADIDPGAPPAPLAAADLCWDVATGRGGHWVVVSSHPAVLEDVKTGLVRADPGHEPMAAWVSRGVINGTRAGVHLRDLADAANLIAPPDDPARVAELASTLVGASEFMAAVRRCSWAMRRPDERTIRLDVELQLEDPPTATASSRGGG